MKLEFFPAAQQEFEEAAGWYESRMPGLGAEFAEEIERIAKRLLELHSLGEKLDETHRRISLRRFRACSIQVADTPKRICCGDCWL